MLINEGKETQFQVSGPLSDGLSANLVYAVLNSHFFCYWQGGGGFGIQTLTTCWLMPQQASSFISPHLRLIREGIQGKGFVPGVHKVDGLL